MNRRDFLRRSALIAASGVAADQLDILEQLGGWVRRFFPGFTAANSPNYSHPAVTMAQWDALLEESYVHYQIVEAIDMATPFKSMMRAPKRLLDATGKPIDSYPMWSETRDAVETIGVPYNGSDRPSTRLAGTMIDGLT